MYIQKTTHLAAALVLVFALVGCDKSETTTSSSATTATTATSPSNEPAVVDWKVTEKNEYKTTWTVSINRLLQENLKT